MTSTASTITSLEIAELLKCNYYKIMHLIHSKESAWHKVSKSSFILSSYISERREVMPMYILSKTELYFISKQFTKADFKKIIKHLEAKNPRSFKQYAQEQLAIIYHKTLNRADRREKQGKSHLVLRLATYYLVSITAKSSLSIKHLMPSKWN